MFVAHKSNQILSIEDTEWECRRKAKGIKTLDEYWAWIETITDSDRVITYPSEDFTIVEVRDEDESRIDDLMSYISFGIDFPLYNIKYYASKKDVLDSDGNKIVDVPAHKIFNEDGKETDVAATYVQSHFVPDDSAKDARILADEWTQIRSKRDRLLTESDWTQGADSPLASGKKTEWATYRTKLRTLPEDQKDKTTYASITWPSEPS